MAGNQTKDWPFGDLKMSHYSAILSDPPWAFRNYSAKGHRKGPQHQYPCMDLEALKKLPVAELAHPDGCALTCWATAPMYPVALELILAWGFTYKSMGAWAKKSTTGKKWAFSTGYCYRSAAEFWILATRGKVRPQSRSVRNLIVAPIRGHSRKPDQMRRDVEELWTGPYCELFARERADGWDGWGAELPPEGELASADRGR